MQIENLQLFCDLVETQSFTRAAGKNYITTPAVTQMLHNLERDIGEPLVQRSRHKFQLTRAGEIFYQYASEIVRLYANAVRRVQEVGVTIGGVIELGVCPSILLHQLPPVQKQFQQKFPAVQINVRHGLIDRVHQQVLDNDVDLGLVCYPRRLPGLTVDPFRHERLVLVCHPRHPLATRTTVTVPELKGHSFVAWNEIRWSPFLRNVPDWQRHLFEPHHEAIHACGWDVLILSSRDDHPFALSMFKGDTKVSLLVYIWNLTHGGFPRDPNEFRIQVTGVSQIELREGWKTLLLGWSDDLNAFAGFDATKHQISMSGRSPSIQIKRDALEKAVKNGFATQARDNQEIAIAFRPDFFTSYVLGSSELHQTTAGILETKALERISREEAVDFDLEDIEPKARRQVLQTVNRKIRDARFRANVLRAYSHRCCVCGIQLDLLDAAHIIPVEHERGTDEIKNGLSLCALHHRAFDHALITVRTDYQTASTNHGQSPLDTPSITGMDNDIPTQLAVHLTPITNAVGYEVQILVGTVWTTVQVLVAGAHHHPDRSDDRPGGAGAGTGVGRQHGRKPVVGPQLQHRGLGHRRETRVESRRQATAEG